MAQLEKAPSVSAPNQLALLKKENEKLKQEVEVWKQRLVQAGLSQGVRQFSTSVPPASVPEVKEEKVTKAEVTSQEPKKAKEAKPKEGNHSIISFTHSFSSLHHHLQQFK